MKKETKIDFIGIGAQKSGTTWMFRNLEQIPCFDLLPIKEIHYFDRNTSYPSTNILNNTYFWNRIFNSTQIKKYYLHYARRVYQSIKEGDLKSTRFFLKWIIGTYDDSWYLSLFNNRNGYCGEVTPSYSFLSKEDIKKMYRIAPQAKLILLLRNPVHRAWSHYRFYVANGILKPSNIQEILKFIDSEDQTLRSDYKKIIENYSRIFPKNQLLIGFYDAIIDDPQGLLRDIVNHITENETINIDSTLVNSRINVSPIKKISPKIENHLKTKYHDDMLYFAEEYGGYFSKWYCETFNKSHNSKKHPSTMYLR